MDQVQTPGRFGVWRRQARGPALSRARLPAQLSRDIGSTGAVDFEKEFPDQEVWGNGTYSKMVSLAGPDMQMSSRRKFCLISKHRQKQLVRQVHAPLYLRASPAHV